jgi:NAD(P)-dependent dehydrogenase (short-subunit alcohol dehydrogenase family)
MAPLTFETMRNPHDNNASSTRRCCANRSRLPTTPTKSGRRLRPCIRSAAQIEEVVALLISPAASFVTGQIIKVDGELMARLGGSPKKA